MISGPDGFAPHRGRAAVPSVCDQRIVKGEGHERHCKPATLGGRPAGGRRCRRRRPSGRPRGVQFGGAGTGDTVKASPDGVDDGTELTLWTRAPLEKQAKLLVEAYDASHKNQ